MAIRGRGGKLGEPRLPTRPEVDLYSEAPAQLPEIVIAPPKGLSVKQIPVGGVVKTPIKQPPMPMPPVKPPRAEPVKVPVKQPPMPMPDPVPNIPAPMPDPILNIPAPMPTPLPTPVGPPKAPGPVPMPEPIPIPQVPAPTPVPQPVPMPQIPAPMPGPVPTPLPTPIPPPVKPMPGESGPIIANPGTPPIPVPPVVTPPVLPPAPPVNELPPPIQVPPPINVPAPPEDIVSRGTVGPVAPPPVEVPPPVMSPELGGVSPPIPLAPSQPGVPTPMAPGSFQGVLPAPTPEAAPAMPAIDPEVLAQIERELSGPGGFTPPAEIVQQFEEPLNMDGATGGISGIETMAPAVGFGDYLGSEVNEAGLPALSETAPAGDIPLPDGSSFDLTSLNLSDTDMSELASGNFNIGNINLGQIGTGVDPSLYSDPALGGGPPPMEVGTLGGPVYDENGNLIGNLGTAGPLFGEAGGMPPRGGEFDPGIALPVDDSLRTTPNTGTPTFGPQVPVTATDYFHYHELIDSGLSPDQIDTSNLSGFGQSAGTSDPYNPTVNDNPYPFIPDGIDTSNMTDEQLAAVNAFYEGGGMANINIGGIPGLGNIGPINIGGTTGTTGGSYTVTPVAPVGDLNTGDGSTDGQVGTAPPPGPVDVRSASTFGLTGAQPTMPVGTNPFQRPESQQGIGSLAGGG